MTDETHCKLCGWSDDQQKVELAMECFGLWKRGEQCNVTATYLGRCIRCGNLRKFDHFVGEQSHTIPCPDPLTDGAVAMRLLEAVAKRDHVCSIKITTYQGQWWVVIEDYGSKPRFEGIGDTLGLAIVRAAAALAQQK